MRKRKQLLIKNIKTTPTRQQKKENYILKYNNRSKITMNKVKLPIKRRESRAQEATATRFPPEHTALIRRVAKANKSTASDVIRTAVHEFFVKHGLISAGN